MSAASMFGQPIALGTTVGEGELYFSDGTVQTTAFTPSNITVDYITVNNSATIGSSSTEDTTSLTIYGSVQQKLSANYCTQFGSNALSGGNNTGENNTAFGYGSMQNNSTGYSNASFGDYSLYTNTLGGQNVAIGHSSLQNNQSGGQNTSIGCSSLLNNATGSNNTALGYNSNLGTTTATYTTAIGSGANCANFTESTAIGYSATNTASNQIMLGTSDETVTIPGALVLDGLVSQVLSSSQSTQYGYNSLKQGSGTGNTAVGYSSMEGNTTGSYNVSLGDYALNNNSTGGNNTAIGHNSQAYGTGDYNTSVGGSSLQGTFGSATGSYNTALGYNSNAGTTTATNTTAIGSGSNCANFTESTAIGYNATNTASNQIMLGTSAETVQINGILNVGTTSTYDTANVVNIYGGFNVNANSSENIPTNDNTIVGQNNNFYAGTNNNFYSQENYFDAYTNTFTGTTNIDGNSTIGSSSSNTSTVNAVPNFVNGFKCAGATAYKLFMGTATYTSGGYNGSTSIPPYAGTYYGDGNAYYNLDQTIPNIIGCFINSQNTNFTVWYVSQTSTSQLYLSYVNLTTDYQTLPNQVVYMAFSAS